MAPRSSETYHLFTATRRLGIVASRILVHENMKSPRNYQTSSLGLGSKECGISLWQCNAFQINQFPWIDISANIPNNDNKNTTCNCLWCKKSCGISNSMLLPSHRRPSKWWWKTYGREACICVNLWMRRHEKLQMAGICLKYMISGLQNVNKKTN